MGVCSRSHRDPRLQSRWKGRGHLQSTSSLRSTPGLVETAFCTSNHGPWTSGCRYDVRPELCDSRSRSRSSGLGPKPCYYYGDAGCEPSVPGVGYHGSLSFGTWFATLLSGHPPIHMHLRRFTPTPCSRRWCLPGLLRRSSVMLSTPSTCSVSTPDSSSGSGTPRSTFSTLWALDRRHL